MPERRKPPFVPMHSAILQVLMTIGPAAPHRVRREVERSSGLVLNPSSVSTAMRICVEHGWLELVEPTHATTYRLTPKGRRRARREGTAWDALRFRTEGGPAVEGVVAAFSAMTPDRKLEAFRLMAALIEIPQE